MNMSDARPYHQIVASVEQPSSRMAPYLAAVFPIRPWTVPSPRPGRIEVATVSRGDRVLEWWIVPLANPVRRLRELRLTTEAPLSGSCIPAYCRLERLANLTA